MVNYYRVSDDTKFGAILSKAVISLLAVFTLYIIYLNFWYTAEYKALLYVLLVIPVFAIIYLISYKLNISPVSFAITIFVLAFLSKSILVFMTATKPISDFDTFYQSAIMLLNGDKSFGHTFYFKTWAYQTGPVIYYSAIMKLFGTGLLPL
ncbi:MAG: glycosyltransferase family 39 protein, partial [Ruminiclostridium sp.]